MKLLIYNWYSYLQDDICAICKEQGIAYDIFTWQFKDKNQDEEFERWFDKSVDGAQYDAVLSVNYWPLISKGCWQKRMKYIAWCYDNPLNIVNLEATLANPINYVFFFDKVQFLKYKKAGFETVWHLPLGVNRTRLEKLEVSDKEYRRYHAEVSFVGKLYESQLYNILAPMNEYTQGYLTALMDVQFKIYGYYLIDELLSEDLINEINGQYLRKKPDTKFRLSKEALSYAMASEVTRRDRIILLNLFGRRFGTKHFCYQSSDLIQGVEQCGGVDYVSEMPKVFASSKINLNPSLRIIQSGIPLRAFDIMGAGGFLLSNYQEELMELYENEKEMVVYEGVEDALEKADFYLRNENLRIKIAERGREKTFREHSLQSRLKDIIAIAGI